MIGWAIVAVGGLLVWAAFTGRAAAVLTALKTDITSPAAAQATPATAPTATTGSSTNPNAFNPANPITAYQPGPGGSGASFTGASGNTYTGSYASLTPAQRDDVNNFAHAHPNGI